MSYAEKNEVLADIVYNECFCLWELFAENVDSYGTNKFYGELRKCKNREDIRRLVNKVI